MSDHGHPHYGSTPPNGPSGPSGPYGPPPPGGGSYGPPPPDHGGYGPPPPGAAPYGPPPPPPPGPGYGPPHPMGPGPYPRPPLPPEQQPPSGGTITALVVSILLVPLCMGNITPIIGTVLAGIALSERSRDPQRHNQLRRYAWISNCIHLALVAVLAAFIATLIIVDP